MDDFYSNMKNGQFGHQSELPEGFGWDDMREGIYEKMQKTKSKKNNRPWWWLLLLLLIIGGIGSWFALEYSDHEKVITQPIGSIQDNKKETDTASENIHTEMTLPQQSDIANSTKTTLPQLELRHQQISNKKKTIVKSSSSTTNTLKIPVKSPQNTINNNLKESQNIRQKELNTPSNHDALSQDKKDETINHLNVNTVAVSSETPAEITKLPAIDIGLIESPPLAINSFKTPQNTDTPTIFKKHISLGIASGITNWTAFDATNINHEYVSGFPGYHINPSISLSFSPKHALQMDYEYSSLEELFDYEGTHEIETLEEDLPIRQVVSSLTQRVLHTEYKDTILSGNRYQREVKYNQYQLHTLSLGYRFDQAISQKSSLGFYTGASYLWQLSGKGKRLNEQQDVTVFNNDNPLFKKNQLGLRFDIHYNYQLNPNTKLFSQITTTKYITNWEIDGSNSATRPLLYGLQIGLRYRLTK